MAVSIPDKGIILVVSNTDNYGATNIELIKSIVTDKKKHCIYLSLNLPSFTLLESYKEAGIDVSKIFIVDCVTRLATEELERAGNVVFVDSPQNLTDVGQVLDGTFKDIPVENSFLFLDSVSTLLLYNTAKNVAAFIHFLTLKIRTYRMSGVIVSLDEEESKQLLPQIRQFCDSQIVVT